MIKYNLIRSDRKTISISIGKNGVTVRAPKRASEAEIERFLKENSSWGLKEEKRLLPTSNGPDGFYIALLIKK